MLKQFIREFFQFSRKERAGIILLSILIIFTHYLPDWINPPYLPDTDKDLQAAVDDFHRQLIYDSIITVPKTVRLPKYPVQKSFTRYKDTLSHYVKKKPPIIDINTADSLQWQLLPGIGPGFSRRIVKFREALGGFYEVQQVAECYGLPDSTFQKIQPFLKIGDSSLKILDLNLTDEKSLASHPYIRYKLAHLIVQYRSMHAGFSQVSDLRQLPLVDDIIYRKIEHYITVKH
ncbi:hypothetical protein DVR12_25715 [Chitinophaga silvatica]|uniref:DNA uptake protein ComE n=1 Tax=Chitinophaga silvatica TaxID=2282649 RepID=A0A3E1Y2W4_9BACT|nr:helix-hairpin-helix domain-containing protein [Chitinophaga silvatica]RFS19002.1 hypothetical protein DVR12_25715 [Chitinophaga silvatica]